MLLNERSMQRFAFYIDSEQNKACNLHVAQRPLTKGVLFAPGDTDVTWRREKFRAAGRQATTNLNSSGETMKARLVNQIAIVTGSSLRQTHPIPKPRLHCFLPMN